VPDVRLAEHRRDAEAELAAAKSGAVKAMAANEDIKRGTATLMDEMQRKSGDSR